MARIFVALAVLFMLVISMSCQHQPYVVPVSQRTGDPTICFESDILPIFVSQCAKSGCHDAQRHKKGYVLDSYENIVKKGIAPGNAMGSTIYKSLLGYTDQMMPAEAPPLSSDQIALIKRWINAGAIKDSNCAQPCDSDNYVYAAGVKPIMDKYCIGCHSGSSAQGSLTLDSYDAVKNAIANKNLINCVNYVSGYNAMPKGGLHLSTCQIRQIEKWAAAGMLNN